jgi:hypothetical protein
VGGWATVLYHATIIHTASALTFTEICVYCSLVTPSTSALHIIVASVLFGCWLFHISDSKVLCGVEEQRKTPTSLWNIDFNVKIQWRALDSLPSVLWGVNFIHEPLRR